MIQTKFFWSDDSDKLQKEVNEWLEFIAGDIDILFANISAAYGTGERVVYQITYKKRKWRWAAWRILVNGAALAMLIRIVFNLAGLLKW